MKAIIQLTEEVNDNFFEELIDYFNGECDWYYFDELERKKFDIKLETKDLEEFYEEIFVVCGIDDANKLAQKFLGRGNGIENI